MEPIGILQKCSRLRRGLLVILSVGYAKHLEDEYILRVPRFFMCVFIKFGSDNP